MSGLGALLTEFGSDKDRHHRYGPVYGRAFGHLRDAPIAFLEVGISAGASMRAWSRWFTQATIVGLDVNGAPEGTPGICLTGNATDRAFMERVGAEHGPFDVVLDDGSHRWADQQATFGLLWPHVRPGGLYIIEDLGTSFEPMYATHGPDTVTWLGGLVGSLMAHRDGDVAGMTLAHEIVLIEKRA